MELLGPEKVDPADVKLIKKKLFGYSTFWVTKEEPFGDLGEGILFLGNLRGKREEVFSKLQNQLAELMGNEYNLFMVEEPNSEGPDLRGGPRVSFGMLRKEVSEPGPTTLWQYVIALLLFVLTISSSVELGIASQINRLPPEVVKYFTYPNAIEPPDMQLLFPFVELCPGIWCPGGSAISRVVDDSCASCWAQKASSVHANLEISDFGFHARVKDSTLERPSFVQNSARAKECWLERGLQALRCPGIGPELGASVIVRDLVPDMDHFLTLSCGTLSWLTYLELFWFCTGVEYGGLNFEVGHFLAAFPKKVKLSIPFFIPNITLGSFGAITHITSWLLQFKSILPGRKTKVDISLAGPFAGATLSFSMFVVGLLISSNPNAAGDLVQVPSMLFQGSLLLGLISRATLGYVCGLTTSAFNMLPVGCLDGGRAIQIVNGLKELDRFDGDQVLVCGSGDTYGGVIDPMGSSMRTKETAKDTIFLREIERRKNRDVKDPALGKNALIGFGLTTYTLLGLGVVYLRFMDSNTGVGCVYFPDLLFSPSSLVDLCHFLGVCMC
ncbi:hypothetical protein HYC85_025434 [Camellia sinensis]|uniref:Peptidase M50 domain-containing protein n=1 Tax=Camellia sinensis TaxID=4442 RepID=A0A7J7GES1_CAMSI|nr:hypothetical protein HYC85_025434 [Camellia sinensis]